MLCSELSCCTRAESFDELQGRRRNRVTGPGGSYAYSPAASNRLSAAEGATGYVYDGAGNINNGWRVLQVVRVTGFVVGSVVLCAVTRQGSPALKVKVLDPAGVSVTRSAVKAVSARTGRILALSTSGGGGVASVAVDDSADVLVYARADNLAGVGISPGESVRQDLQIVLSAADIEGTVLRDGRAVPGAKILVALREASPLFRRGRYLKRSIPAEEFLAPMQSLPILTDAKGRFAVALAIPGVYDIEVRDENGKRVLRGTVTSGTKGIAAHLDSKSPRLDVPPSTIIIKSGDNWSGRH